MLGLCYALFLVVKTELPSIAHTRLPEYPGERLNGLYQQFVHWGQIPQITPFITPTNPFRIPKSVVNEIVGIRFPFLFIDFLGATIMLAHSFEAYSVSLNFYAVKLSNLANLYYNYLLYNNILAT
jgi:hypothetical protein